MSWEGSPHLLGTGGVTPHTRASAAHPRWKHPLSSPIHRALATGEGWTCSGAPAAPQGLDCPGAIPGWPRRLRSPSRLHSAGCRVALSHVTTPIRASASCVYEKARWTGWSLSLSGLVKCSWKERQCPEGKALPTVLRLQPLRHRGQSRRQLC